jgi:hypothetical protein
VVVVTHLLAESALVKGVVDRVVEMTIPRELTEVGAMRLRRILVPAEMTGRELMRRGFALGAADRFPARLLRRLLALRQRRRDHRRDRDGVLDRRRVDLRRADRTARRLAAGARRLSPV